MTADGLRGAARRVSLAWGPMHTFALLALLAAGMGFLPFVKMSLVVNGVVLASIIALGAIGLTLIYGILNFANIAHGDYMTLGAYVALFFAGTLLPSFGAEGGGIGPFTFGYPLLVALPLSIAAVAALAVALDALLYRRLRERGVNAVLISMASLGVAIGLRGLVQMLWSGDVQRLPRESREVWHLPMDVRVPPDSLFIAAVAIVLVAATYLVLSRTKMGKAMRATADNPDLALVSGISTQRVIRWTWVMGAALAATAGVLLAVFQANIIPIMGWKFLIPLFAAVILGGIGSPYGALAGAFIIGVTMEVSTQWINPSYKPAAAFALMLLMLLMRPRGLFGSRQ
ncbi:MAG: branched-chain amino acid ABC transporter permease [Chloroflexota bacterium]|nr:branched-chain amino acid ABC transporter permease [Chloroflexota bacterium]